MKEVVVFDLRFHLNTPPEIKYIYVSNIQTAVNRYRNLYSQFANHPKIQLPLLRLLTISKKLMRMNEYDDAAEAARIKINPPKISDISFYSTNTTSHTKNDGVTGDFLDEIISIAAKTTSAEAESDVNATHVSIFTTLDTFTEGESVWRDKLQRDILDGNPSAAQGSITIDIVYISLPISKDVNFDSDLGKIAIFAGGFDNIYVSRIYNNINSLWKEFCKLFQRSMARKRVRLELSTFNGEKTILMLDMVRETLPRLKFTQNKVCKCHGIAVNTFGDHEYCSITRESVASAAHVMNGVEPMSLPRSELGQAGKSVGTAQADNTMEFTCMSKLNINSLNISGIIRRRPFALIPTTDSLNYGELNSSRWAYLCRSLAEQKFALLLRETNSVPVNYWVIYADMKGSLMYLMEVASAEELLPVDRIANEQLEYERDPEFEETLKNLEVENFRILKLKSNYHETVQKYREEQPVGRVAPQHGISSAELKKDLGNLAEKLTGLLRERKTQAKLGRYCTIKESEVPAIRNKMRKPRTRAPKKPQEGAKRRATPKKRKMQLEIREE